MLTLSPGIQTSLGVTYVLSIRDEITFKRQIALLCSLYLILTDKHEHSYIKMIDTSQTLSYQNMHISTLVLKSHYVFKYRYSI